MESELAVGDTLSVGNVRDRFKNFVIVNDDDYTLATVTPPALEEADPGVKNVSPDDTEATGKKLSPENPA